MTATMTVDILAVDLLGAVIGHLRVGLPCAADEGAQLITVQTVDPTYGSAELTVVKRNPAAHPG